MKSLDIAWAAGLIEGEGCPHYNGSPRLSLAMTDEDVVRRFAGLFGGNVARRDRVNPKATKPVFVWSACGKRAIGAMLTLYSLLGSRRRAKIRAIILEWKTRKIGATSEQAKARWAGRERPALLAGLAKARVARHG